MNLILERLSKLKITAVSNDGGGFSSLKRFLDHRAIGILAGLLIVVSCYGQQWASVGQGLNNAPPKLYYDTVTNELIAGGKFRKADNKWAMAIASWNGSNWDSLGHGLDFFDTLGSPNAPSCNVWDIERYNGYLYCGGSFEKAGNIFTNGFARWDGADWDSVPGADLASYRTVFDILVFGSELYICGTFDSVGSVPADGIAKWNGTTWSAIGPNYDFIQSSDMLHKMKFYHGNLYVTGVFYDPQGNSCHLAKWDGANWTFLTNDFVGTTFLYDLEIYNDELYVCGLFYSSVGNVATSIVRWNDTTWRDVGGSVEIGSSNPFPTMTDMCINGGKLYCVGNFEIVGGIYAPHVASWDGTNWCGYGSIFDNRLMQVAFYEDTMYVSGQFWTIDGDSIKNIVKWIGGSFVDTCGNTTAIEEPESTQPILVYPNPASEIITFQFSDSHQSRSIIICDALGRQIWRKETSESVVQFPALEYSSGIYFYTIIDNESGSATGKFIIER